MTEALWIFCIITDFVLILFVKILPLNSPCRRRPAHDEWRLRCRGGDCPASHHSPPQGALLWPGGWEQPGVPEGEEHGTWPATGLQHDGTEEEGFHDPPEPGQWNRPVQLHEESKRNHCCQSQHFKQWIEAFRCSRVVNITCWLQSIPHRQWFL